MFRIFRHYVPKTLLLLGLTEALIMFVSVYVGVIFRFFDWEAHAIHTYDTHNNLLLVTAITFCVVMLIIMTVMGLYQRDSRDSHVFVLVRIALSFAMGLMLMTLFFYAFPNLFLGRGAFGIALAAAFLGIVSCRLLCFQKTDTLLKKRVLVVGVGEQARLITQLRRKTDLRGVSIVGYVAIGNGTKSIPDNKILSINTPLPEFVEENDIDEIVIALDDRRNNMPIDLMLDCKMKGINIIDVPTFYERQLGKIRLESLHPSNIVFSDGFSQAVIKPTTKRIFDLIMGVVVIIPALPLMAFVALAILIESKWTGPVIYRQTRVGRGNKPFEVLKFRSMRVDAEKDGIAKWATTNDDRITRVGAFIRKTRLDELPQLINVIRGEMSFVGPRPERPQFVEQLSGIIPYYALRHHVKPGITGWAQILYPYGASIEDSREKLQYDLYYMKNYSLFLDLSILVETLQVILWGKGAR